MSNLQFNKILYIAHMVHLGPHGVPLVDGRFEAWDYGPVHPTLYHHAKVFGSSPVGNIFHSVGEIPPGPEAETLDAALESLRNARPGQLVAMTHRGDGAWARHYVPRQRNTIIPDADILAEYRTLVPERNAAHPGPLASAHA
ncbi:MAG: DUF4065 domain-containing protein [Rhodospirillales bacterium]|nr:MAG: DUF4065 domain-containing protein [Rhodospirillales bacterium]